MKYMGFEEARDMLLEAVKAVGTEEMPLPLCGGRILARTLTAAENVPPFDRSPYDGYAFRAEDVTEASRETPVTLRILEEVAAGAVPTKTVTAGTAVKILTGAPIPPGADAVVKFEETEFTAETVTIFAPFKSGQNIVRMGEDVTAGQVLAQPGQIIDPGLAGTLAAQGVYAPVVYKKPRVGILSTGNEVVGETVEPLPAGKIRNTNRYMLEAALSAAGCEPVFLGIAGDTAEAVRDGMAKGLDRCDAIVLTGGVSVGDYDMTPAAMELLGAEILVPGVDLKPGGACAYGRKDGVLLCGLSGNPASAMTNFYAIALPALRKMAGYKQPCLREIPVTLAGDFRKKSPKPRLLRGRLELGEGTVLFVQTGDQGNAVVSSLMGCEALAAVPAGSGPLPAGTVLKGFLI